MRHRVILIILCLFCTVAAAQTQLPPPAAESVLPTPTLPSPKTISETPVHLSLKEAIALALRSNPAVRISELQRILDKFGLATVMQTYGVVWTPFTASATLQKHVYPVWSAGTGFSVAAPSGTTIGLSHTTNLLGGAGNTGLTVTQHLLQGFGFAVNRVNAQNAMDTERIARLTFKNSVIDVVNTVITNYRALVESYNNLTTSQQTLKSQEKGVWQSKLQVKAGKMAPADLLQQEENLETTRLSVVQAEDALRDAYQTFLSSLGLSPTKKLLIDRSIVVNTKKVPSLDHCIAIALKNNIAYQTALLQLKITKRALITAEDADKWTLDVTGTKNFGDQRTGVGQPLTSLTTNPTLAVSLSVPINDISLKQAVESAKIGIQDAELNLHQQKEDLIRSVMNEYETIKNQESQLNISERAVMMQEKTVENTKLKLKYGKTTIFEVNTLENELLSQKIALIATKISYLNAVTTLYQTLGLTLKQWHVHLRY